MRCLKKHTQKSPHFISFRVWFGRASRCTLRGNRESRTVVESFVQQVARYEENRELRISVKSFVHQDARYEGIVDYALGLIHSCY